MHTHTHKHTHTHTHTHTQVGNTGCIGPMGLFHPALFTPLAAHAAQRKPFSDPEEARMYVCACVCVCVCVCVCMYMRPKPCVYVNMPDHGRGFHHRYAAEADLNPNYTQPKPCVYVNTPDHGRGLHHRYAAEPPWWRPEVHCTKKNYCKNFFYCILLYK